MSGFLGQMLQGVLGAAPGQQGQASPISTILQQVLTMQDGDKQGVAAIVQKFQNAGLGSSVQSWVGTGTNQPVSAGDIGNVFSADQLQGWAQQAGTTPDALRNVLAEALPHAVDHLTPGGDVPQQTPPQGIDVAGILGRLMGGGMRTT